MADVLIYRGPHSSGAVPDSVIRTIRAILDFGENCPGNLTFDCHFFATFALKMGLPYPAVRGVARLSF